MPDSKDGHEPCQRSLDRRRGLIGVFHFGQLDGPLVVKLALSPVSEENAIANLDGEVPAFAFRCRARRRPPRLGRSALARARHRRHGGHAEEPLHTASNHSLLAPSAAGDLDGSHRGPDNQVHRAAGFHFVSTFSLWDTFRAEQPLMTLLEARQPHQRRSAVRWWIRSATVRRDSPIWQFQGLETGA